MKFALSTNWNNRRLTTGEAIVDEALKLGFDALELGFHTTPEQVSGFKARLGEMPVGSIHAFCPVPLSAPQGYPELYQLASFDDAARALARVHVRKNVEFAAEMGADAVVLHAGRVMCSTFFKRNRLKKRTKRGRKLVEIFKKELDALVPVLEANKVSLGLENLPYLEGFPNEVELRDLVGDWVRPWFDAGHDYVRRQKGWVVGETLSSPLGLHLHDSNGGDDHLAPGEGKIDFAALRPLAEAARHLVLEPGPDVSGDALRRGLARLRVWFSPDAARPPEGVEP
jgi:sugar phosphate isomerase/epimerase